MDKLAEFLYGKCYLCERSGVVICQRCFSQLEIVHDQCFVCKNYSPDGKTHPGCRSEFSPITFKSFYKYSPKSSRILIKSKYEPFEFYLLKFLIKNTELELCFPKDSIFTPIPLSSLKMYERKFNQSELISKEVCKKFGFNSLNLLKRKRDTSSLYELGFWERKEQVSGVFEPNFFAKLFQKHPIVIVDDLKTTGHTLGEAIKSLKNAGFENIHAFSLFIA